MTDVKVYKDRYRVTETLNQLEYITTYLADDMRCKRQCVVKCLNIRKADSLETIDLFRRQSKILPHLKHPNIPEFIDFFSSESVDEVELCVVQEYIPGKSLGQCIEDGRHFTEDEIIDVIMEIAKVLEYLHDFSPPVIHRNINPNNIILGNDGKTCLTDFGALKLLLKEDISLPVNTLAESYGYVPVEVYEGNANVTSDIYGLGMSAIYALSHRDPESLMNTRQEIEFKKHVNISFEFACILQTMVEHDWQKRYQSAARLSEDLRKLKIEVRLEPKSQIRSRIMVAIMGTIVIITVFAFLNLFLKESSQTRLLQNQSPETRVEKEKQSAENPKTAITDLDIPESLSDAVVKGQLFYNGEPVTYVTSVKPSFWFRNNDKNVEERPDVRYENSKFAIIGLPTGSIGVSINIDHNEKNPFSYPGDFRSWTVFSVSENNKPELNVDMQKIIHLTSPQDNGTVMEHWGAECNEKITLSSPVRFEWKSLGPGVYYDFDITIADCLNNYNTKDSVTGNTIHDTSVNISLPPSKKDECYLFRLHGRSDGRTVGMLITHGANGYGWDYRFRIK